MRLPDRRGFEFSIAVKQHKHIRALINEIPEADWQAVIDYPDTGEAQVAEHEHPTTGFRLVARRIRLVGAQADLFPNWRHLASLTNRDLPVLVADTDHRNHRTRHPRRQRPSSLRIRGDRRIAHNLARWTTLIGFPNRAAQTARTRRRQLLLDTRSTDPHRASMDAPAPRPLAMEDRLHAALSTIRALPAPA